MSIFLVFLVFIIAMEFSVELWCLILLKLSLLLDVSIAGNVITRVCLSGDFLREECVRLLRIQLP